MSIGSVLVTGGAGFIGSHTVDALLSRGYRVKILDSLEKPVHMHGKPKYIPNEAEFVLGDVRRKDDWVKALENVNAVFHLAAYQDYLLDFSKFFHVNSVGTALLYEVIVEKGLEIERVVLASSQAVYGEGRYVCEEHGVLNPHSRPIDQLERGEWELRCPKCGLEISPVETDESAVNPQNQYAISKYSQELIAMHLGRRYDIPTIGLRYSIVQGSRQSFYNAYSGACRIFCTSLMFNKAPTIFEDGRQLRDFVNIEDVVKANLLVLGEPAADFEVFNVGGGRAYSVLEFYATVAKLCGREIPPAIPGEFRLGDTRHSFSDISKLRNLGWEPRNTVEKSVEDYLAWLEESEALEDVGEASIRQMKEMQIVRSAHAK